MTKFVILSLPRTGSTLLSKSLNTHPEIFCEDEIFHFSFRDYFSSNQFRFLKIPIFPKKINYVINYPFTYLRLTNFLDKYFINKPGENFKARGFKLMYYQTFYTPGIINYLKEKNIKVILLMRENTLRNALSCLRAKATGIYHYLDDNEQHLLNLPKFEVNTALLKRQMNSIMYQNEKLEFIVHEMDYLKINYEDFSDWDNTIKRIEKFLNVSYHHISVEAKKLNPDALQDMVSNYNELSSWLKINNYTAFTT